MSTCAGGYYVKKEAWILWAISRQWHACNALAFDTYSVVILEACYSSEQTARGSCLRRVHTPAGETDPKPQNLKGLSGLPWWLSGKESTC